MGLFLSAQLFIAAQQIGTVQHPLMLFPQGLVVLRRVVDAEKAQNHKAAGDGAAGGGPLEAAAEVGADAQGLLLRQPRVGCEGQHHGLAAVVMRRHDAP